MGSIPSSVVSLPMRDGNSGLYRSWKRKEKVVSLPMRDGNWKKRKVQYSSTECC